MIRKGEQGLGEQKEMTRKSGAVALLVELTDALRRGWKIGGELCARSGRCTLGHLYQGSEASQWDEGWRSHFGYCEQAAENKQLRTPFLLRFLQASEGVGVKLVMRPAG